MTTQAAGRATQEAVGPEAARYGQRALIRRLFRTYLAPRWRGLVGALVCAVAAGALTGVLAWILNPAVKRIFEQKRADSLVLIPLAIVGLGLVRALAQVGQAWITNRIGHRMVGDIQTELFAKLIRADLARLRAAHSGRHLSSVIYDAGLIREGATTGVINYTQAGVTVIANLVVMLTQDWLLTLIVLCAGPPLSTVMRRFGARTRSAAKGAMTETSALSTAVMESLDGVKLVKIDNREAYEEARIAQVIARRQDHIVAGANARAAAAPATEAATMLVVAAILAFAGWRAIHNQVHLGQFVAFLAALLSASQALRQVANLQAVMSEGLAAAARLFADLDVEPEISDAPGTPSLELAAPTVRFEQVRFHYGPETPAVDGVTLEVARGEIVALVGPSGGGKTTLLNLIPRFYDVTAGRVTIGGVDVRSVTLASLRDQIALVTQEPFLFDDTIRANIAYARPDAPMALVEAAAKAAAAHDFVSALPKGYDTSVGEAGGRLSGGQRQRIAIARAFLKDAPILLLDEATSALDAESEAKVQEALTRLMAGRTTLLIAHRLSTVRRADRIYVLEAGRVVDSGTHATLMAGQGLYARLARAQDLDAHTSTAADVDLRALGLHPQGAQAAVS